MYTEISIIAPDSALAGQTVNVEVRVKNLVDYTIYAIPVLDVDGSRSEGSYQTIVPGQIRSWYFSFPMPSESVTVTAESWCEDTFEWQSDATAQKAISLGVAAPDWITPLITMAVLMGMVAMMAPAMKEGLK